MITQNRLMKYWDYAFNNIRCLKDTSGGFHSDTIHTPPVELYRCPLLEAPNIYILTATKSQSTSFRLFKDQLLGGPHWVIHKR